MNLLRRPFVMPNGRLSKLAVGWVLVVSGATAVQIAGWVGGWWCVR